MAMRDSNSLFSHQDRSLHESECRVHQMATLLFPAFNEKSTVYNRWAYASILKDIIRACSDSIDALTLFRNLLLGKDGGPDSVGFMAFDAHGGDTGCHLRAGMFQELFDVHRELIVDPKTKLLKNPDWIDTYLGRLKRLRESAKDACIQLTKKRLMPSVLGLGDKKDSAQRILAILGWDESFKGPLYGRPISVCPSDEETSLKPNSKAHSPSQTIGEIEATLDSNLQTHQRTHVLKIPRDKTLLNENFQAEARPSALLDEKGEQDVFSPSEPIDGRESESPHVVPQLSHATSVESLGMSDCSLESNPLSSASSVSDISCYDEPSKLRTTWRTHDAATLIRLLVYSYILSKYKSFCRLSNVVSARVSPDMALEMSERLIEPCIDRKNREYKPLKITRYLAEFAAYQAWLSDLSCAWTYSLAIRSNTTPSLTRLMVTSIQKSPKGLTAMACFPTYLLLRETWSRRQSPMMLIDRYFCPYGYHLNLYLAEMSQLEPKLQARPHALGQRIRWLLKRITIPELLSSREQCVPHLIFMGNSIEGTYEDYLARIPFPDGSRHEASYRHCDSSCSHNAEHNSLFTLADHDRLALAIFAAHRSYPFSLQSGIREQEFVELCMDAVESQQASHGEERLGLKESWLMSRDEGDASGAGRADMRVFGIQHVALETKARIARMVQTAEEQEYVLPLLADVRV